QKGETSGRFEQTKGDGGSGTARTNPPPNARRTPTKARPMLKPWVASLIHPNRYGPTKPPIFPTELTSAMPTGAPPPATTDVVSVQNGPNIDARPSIANEVSASDGMRLRVNALAANAAPPHAAAIVMCHRRSPVRSEWRPTETMPMAATTYGIALSRPTAKSPAPGLAFDNLRQ